MARPKNLSHLSIEALTKLRDDVAAALSRKAEVLQKELCRDWLGLRRGRPGRNAWTKGAQRVEGPQGGREVPGQVWQHLDRQTCTAALNDRGD
jgi:hypothetical protein